MKLSIDMDGVICDFTSRVKEIINSLWPGRIPEGYEAPDWNYTDILLKHDWDSVWREIDDIPDFWETMPAYPENVQALRTFLAVESNHEIFYVTSRRPTCGRPVALQAEQWLVNQGVWPEDNYHAVLVVEHPSVKRHVMAVLGIQYSIDDKGRTVSECNDVNGHKAYLLDRSYNRDKDYGTRVFSLQEFFNAITGRPVAHYVS